MKIIWRPLPGGRAQAPYRGDERLPFTVCSYGPMSGPKLYEAWDKRGSWSTIMGSCLATPDEAKALVLAEIEKAAARS